MVSIKEAKALDPYCWFTMSPPPAQLFAAPYHGVKGKGMP